MVIQPRGLFYVGCNVRSGNTADGFISGSLQSQSGNLLSCIESCFVDCTAGEVSLFPAQTQKIIDFHDENG